MYPEDSNVNDAFNDPHAFRSPLKIIDPSSEYEKNAKTLENFQQNCVYFVKLGVSLESLFNVFSILSVI
jgi:hypothetical protein